MPDNEFKNTDTDEQSNDLQPKKEELKDIEPGQQPPEKEDESKEESSKESEESKEQ